MNTLTAASVPLLSLAIAASKDNPLQMKPVGTLWGAGGVRFIARSFFSVD